MVWTKDALETLATEDAESAGLNANHFRAVITRESGWDISIQSQYPDSTGPNGKEDSWGISQINLPANPEVSLEMAQNPSFALSFMAEAWKGGQASKWSAWGQLKAEYGDGVWPE